MKKIIATICLTFVSLIVMSQTPLSFHVKAGIGSSHFWGGNANSDTRIAYKAGLGAEYAFTKTWVLQSSLSFVSKGAKDDFDNFGKASMNALYIELPIMMAARLNLGRDFNVSLGVGPYVAYGVGGKTSGTLHEYGYDSSYGTGNYRFRLDTFGKLVDGGMGSKRFDTGISLSLNFEYHKFIIGAEGQVGFVNVNPEIGRLIDNSGYYSFAPRNLSSFFIIGYKFWGK